MQSIQTVLPLRALLLAIVPVFCFTQSGAVAAAAARRGIEAANRAWIEGMKQGDAAHIAATYAEDALD